MIFRIARQGLHYLLAHHNLSRILSAAALTLSLANCTTPAASQTNRTDDVQPLLDRAHSVALEQRPSLLIKAAEQSLQSKQWVQTQQILKELTELKLTPEQFARARLLSARLALAQNKPAQAVTLLQDRQLLESLAQLSANEQIDVSLLRAQALAANANFFGSAQELIFIEPLLPTAKIEQNHRDIQQALMQLTDSELQRQLSNTNDERMRGWLQTALTAKHNATSTNAQNWSRKIPVPVNTIRIDANGNNLEQIPSDSVRQIALLLPLNGKLANFGEAIRDGFFAAWYEAKQRGEIVPEIRLYDTDNLGAFALYQKAVSDGANIVIGPLEKAQVAQFFGQTLAVPVIALNRADIEQAPPPNLFQFSLAPEDETAQLAELAIKNNFRNALIIAGDEDLRSREFDILRQRWQTLGGTLVGTAAFHDQQSLSSAIRTALNIPRSEARAREMESLLNRNIESVPHRRHDVDIVFMLAKPTQARSIKPLLDFYYAGDLPIYSTSRIYSGYGPASADRNDLDKVRFTEIPWVLQQTPMKERILADRPNSKNFVRLCALGIDSFSIATRLQQLKAMTGKSVQAQTGAISIDQQGVVQRQLQLAEIRNGVVIATDIDQQ